MKQQILDALAEVDVGNDEHWTADGSVRVDVVSDFVGEEVTRAQIVEACATFNRKHPELTPETQETPDGDNGKNVVTPTQSSEFGLNPWAVNADQVRKNHAEQKAQNTDVLEQLKELQEQRAEIGAEHAKLGGVLAEMDIEIEKLKAKFKEPTLTLKQQIDLVRVADAEEYKEREARRQAILKLAAGDETLLNELKVE